MGGFKGIIALDIDGTVTVGRHTMKEEVSNYLHELIENRWLLIFLTGRTFTFAWPILSVLKGHYYLSVQNGAALFEMPSGVCLKKNYLPLTTIQRIEPIFKSYQKGLLIESGKENEDICFYQPQDFPGKEGEYVLFRKQLSCEKWVESESFNSLPISECAVGKFFASEALALEIAEAIIKQEQLSVVVIRDPFRLGHHLAHINAKSTSKGKILEEFRQMQGLNLPVIGAGDDFNDVEMLEKSTIKIIMKNGPQQLHALADILAPPASEQGIIIGLMEAIEKIHRGDYGRNH